MAMLDRSACTRAVRRGYLADCPGDEVEHQGRVAAAGLKRARALGTRLHGWTELNNETATSQVSGL